MQYIVRKCNKMSKKWSFFVQFATFFYPKTGMVKTRFLSKKKVIIFRAFQQKKKSLVERVKNLQKEKPAYLYSMPLLCTSLEGHRAPLNAVWLAGPAPTACPTNHPPPIYDGHLNDALIVSMGWLIMNSAMQKMHTGRGRRIESCLSLGVPPREFSNKPFSKITPSRSKPSNEQ